MPRRRLVPLASFVAAAALTSGLTACSGTAEDAGPKRPEMIEVIGTAPSSTTTTGRNVGTAITIPLDGSDNITVVPVPGGGTTLPTFATPGGSGNPGGTGGATSTTVAAGPPYRVETGQVTLTDTSRPTAARGDSEEKTSRTLLTTMYVPVGKPKAPLLVFAIGYNSSAEQYHVFLSELASAGYMIAAPEFPLATKTLPGPPSQKDLPNQPGDVSFVIGQLLAAAKRSGPFLNAIDPNRIGVIGHSDGGNTVSAIGLNACCIDSRVKAVVSIAGEKNFMPNTWSSTGTIPYLAIHGTADTITPMKNGEDLFRTAGTPKYFVPIAGADHLGPVTDNALRPKVLRMVVDFYDFYVNAEPAALDRFVADAKEPPMSLNQG